MSVAIDKFSSTVALLRGTDANFALCVSSMLASVAFGLAGIYLMTISADGTWEVTSKPVLAAQSMVFLIAQSFTLSKVSRDFLSVKEDNIARPSDAYYAQCFIVWVIAVITSLYSVSTISTVKEWASFYALDLMWVIVTAICLSKAVRDRSEAAAFEAVALEMREAVLEQMVPIIRGTCLYKIFVWLSALGSAIMVLALMWSWPAESLEVERKLLMTVGDLWCWFSIFHVAKLVRDLGDKFKAKQLKKQMPFQVMVWTSMLGSTAFVVGCIIMLPLDLPQKFFLTAGTFFMISSAFFLAKAVRDVQEINALELGEDDDSGLSE